MCSNREAGRIEVRMDDFSLLSQILMENGYCLLCHLDANSDIVIVEYLHDISTHRFDEVDTEEDMSIENMPLNNNKQGGKCGEDDWTTKYEVTCG